MPSENGTMIEIGNNEATSPLPATGVCGPEHIAPAFLGIFASKLEQTVEPVIKEPAHNGVPSFSVKRAHRRRV